MRQIDQLLFMFENYDKLHLFSFLCCFDAACSFFARAHTINILKQAKMSLICNVVQATADGLYPTNAVGRWKKDKFSQKPARMSAPIEAVITCLKADKNAPSGLIFDIRKELQEIEALTIAYSVRDKGNI